MAILLPVFQDESANFQYTIEIENINVNIKITWNSRVEKWFLCILYNETQICSIKLVENYLLLNQYKATFNFLRGDFIILKISDKQVTELTYDNFGVNWGLFYLTKDEVDIWRDANGI